MANIGLKIAQDPYTGDSLSLADTLAKGIFGDPEAQMKAKALASEVGVRMASRDKLLADTGLISAKTTAEKNDELARESAVAAGPTALDAAVPMPVPVEAPRPSVEGGGYGPQPGIVDPAATKMHDAQIAQNHALWPLIVRSGANPTQLVEGVGKAEGLSALSGGLVPGSTPDPNVQRVAGGLYTGTAPSTSTVWSPGDTAGVDAAARQKILEERGAAQKPVYFDLNGHRYVQNSDGSATEVTGVAAPDAKLVTLPGQGTGVVNTDARGRPTGVSPLPGAEGRPEKPDIVTGPDKKSYAVTTTPDGKVIGTPVSGFGPQIELKQQGDGYIAINTDTNTATPVTGAAPQPKIVMVPKGETPTTQTPEGLKTVPTDIPPPAPPPIYQGKTAKDDALNRIVVIQQKIANKQPITAQEAALFESDYNLAYGTTNEKIIDPATGQTTNTRITPSIPANTPSINDVRAAAGQPLLPPPPPEPKQNVKAPSQEQAQLQQYTPQLVASTGKLDKVTPQQVPSVLMQQILGVNGNDPSFVQQALASTSFASPQQRDFAQSVAEYNQSLLYMLSGKAITSDEYKRAMRSYIPQPGDDANQLAWKADQRHSIISSAVRLGWGNDPETGKVVKDNVKAQGIDLDKFDLTIPRQSSNGGGGDAAPSKAPQAMKDAWSHMAPDAKARAVARYGAQ